MNVYFYCYTVYLHYGSPNHIYAHPEILLYLLKLLQLVCPLGEKHYCRSW